MWAAEKMGFSDWVASVSEPYPEDVIENQPYTRAPTEPYVPRTLPPLDTGEDEAAPSGPAPLTVTPPLVPVEPDKHPEIGPERSAAPTTPNRPSVVPSPPPETPEAVLVNDVAEGLKALLDEDRLAAGCGIASVLGLDAQLQANAEEHALAMATKNEMSHDESPPPIPDWPLWAENILKGTDDVRVAHDEWMQSPGHRDNVVNCNYTHVGIAVGKSAQGVLYWTVQFGGKG